jgi:hypothetical protein
MRSILICQHIPNFFHYSIADKTFICGDFIQEKVLKNYDVMVNIYDFKSYGESIYLAFYAYGEIKYMFYFDEKRYILNDINGEALVDSNNFIDIVRYMDTYVKFPKMSFY